MMESCDAITKILKEAGIRVKIDADNTKSPGWKFNFWEMKGVPIRIFEIGPRDVRRTRVLLLEETCRVKMEKNLASPQKRHLW